MSPLPSLKVDPDIRAAMEQKHPEPFDGLQLIANVATNASNAVQQSTEALSTVYVLMQMMKEHLGPRKFDTLRQKAIAALYPPDEKDEELERLRKENEELKAKLTEKDAPEPEYDEPEYDGDKE